MRKCNNSWKIEKYNYNYSNIEAILRYMRAVAALMANSDDHSPGEMSLPNLTSSTVTIEILPAHR